MQKLFWIGVGGAVGTVARYLVSGLIQRLNGSDFPWGTVGVNVIGCFLFGIIWTLAEARLVISGETRLVVLTGFIGAFTTFSTLVFETEEMLRDSQWELAIMNAGGQTAAGLVSLFLGLAVGRWL